MKYASLCSISVAHGSRDLQQNFCAFSFHYMISWTYLIIHILKHLDKTTTNYHHYFVHTLVFYKYSFLKSLLLQNHEERCPDKVVECPSQNCTVKLARRLIEEHLMTSCPWRIVCCPFCSENHPKSQELVSNGFLLTWSICSAFGLFNNENNHYLYHWHYVFNVNSSKNDNDNNNIILIIIIIIIRWWWW